jgi:hypothetical protein
MMLELILANLTASEIITAILIIISVVIILGAIIYVLGKHKDKDNFNRGNNDNGLVKSEKEVYSPDNKSAFSFQGNKKGGCKQKSDFDPSEVLDLDLDPNGMITDDPKDMFDDHNLMK